MTVNVDALEAADLERAVALHLEVLDMEFLSRFGPRFMRAYYDAWASSPGAIALAATDDDRVAGVLLGAIDPAAHVRAMVREHGVQLALRMLGAALTRPALARDLLVTRGLRYARGLGRLLLSRLRRADRATPEPGGPAIGEITHVLVDPSHQGRGVGRALIEGAIARARAAGLDELVLVTPPDLAARHFYDALGWVSEGSITSRSGERFLRYRYPLH